MNVQWNLHITRPGAANELASFIPAFIDFISFLDYHESP